MDHGESKMDTPEGIQYRQTWAAVLITPAISMDSIDQMDGLLKEVEERFDVDELHAREVLQLKGH